VRKTRESIKELYRKLYESEKNEIVKWARVRWESTRRDREYIKAFSDADISTLDEKKICEKFGMQVLLDPDLSFDEHLELFEKEGDVQRPIALKYLLANFSMWIWGRISYETLKNGESVIATDEGEEFDTLKIMIDFSKISQIDRVKTEVSNIITSHWHAYKEDTPKRKTPKMTDNFDRIFMIGDLIEKEKLELADVARRVFPDERDPVNAYNKVVQDHKRYLELVNGGWRKLRP
jgi:hypothetical protein